MYTTVPLLLDLEWGYPGRERQHAQRNAGC